MAVAIKTTRKAVEISWDPTGTPEEPPAEEKPPGFPAHPIVLPPGEEPHPEHPIYLPPYIDNSLPEPQPHPDHELPKPEEPVDPGYGVDEEQGAGAFPGDPGYSPPPGASVPAPVRRGKGQAKHDQAIGVQVFAQGQEGDWSNTDVKLNDGLAVLSYPTSFKGESYVEVRALDGTLVDSGTIQVK